MMRWMEEIRGDKEDRSACEEIEVSEEKVRRKGDT